jgi:hypothetical protein
LKQEFLAKLGPILERELKLLVGRKASAPQSAAERVYLVALEQPEEPSGPVKEEREDASVTQEEKSLGSMLL